MTPSRSPVGTAPASPTKSETFSSSSIFTQSAIPDQSRTFAGTRGLHRTVTFEVPSERFTEEWGGVLRRRRVVEVWIFAVWLTEF
jgi:hypothetical protein